MSQLGVKQSGSEPSGSVERMSTAINVEADTFDGEVTSVGLTTTLRREWLLFIRQPAASINSVAFFVLVSSLFAIGIGPQPDRLAELAPGLIWVIALLAVLLSVDALFRDDFADGSLEQQLLSVQPLYFQVAARLLVQSAVIALPLVLVAPLLGLMLGLPMAALPTLALSLLLGVPSLVFVGAIGAALTVSFERSGLLLSVLVLPLFIPVLIFASAAVQAAAGGFNVAGQLAVLAAFLMLAIALAPLAVQAALRLSFYF